MRDLEAICIAIDNDFNWSWLRDWSWSGPDDIFRSRKQFKFDNTSICFPPALEQALGDLAELLYTRQWNPPTEVVRALRTLCRSDWCRTNRPIATVEDLRTFLDWAEIAVIEAALDA